MYRQQVNEVYHIFSLLNEKTFNNSLKQPIITIQSKGKLSAMGWCTLSKVWKGEEEKDNQYEINICAEYTDSPLKEIVDTILHEMIHLDNMYKGIKDTSRNNCYHNKLFRDSAIKAGLLVTHDKKVGHAYTSLGDEMIEWLSKQEINRECFHIARESISAKVGTGKAKCKTIKYKCPSCGILVKTSSEVNILCSDCEEEFEMVKKNDE